MIRFQYRLYRNILRSNKIASSCYKIENDIFNKSSSCQIVLFSTKTSESRNLDDDEMFPDIKGSQRRSHLNKEIDDGDDIEEYGLDFSFNEHFDMSQKGSDNIYDIKEGGYIAFNDSDVLKYLPEGFSGDVYEEFEFVSSKTMMVRDVHKIICRIIDRYSKTNATNDQSSSNDTSFATHLKLSGLTTRQEWPSAYMRLYSYGKDVSPEIKWSKPKLVSLRGPESKQEKVYKTLESLSLDNKDNLDANGNKQNKYIYPFPNKILLTGARGVGKSFALSYSVYYARKQGHLIQSS